MLEARLIEALEGMSRRHFLGTSGLLATVMVFPSTLLSQGERREEEHAMINEAEYIIINETNKEMKEGELTLIAKESSPHLDKVVQQFYSKYGTPEKITQTVTNFYEDYNFLNNRSDGDRFIQIANDCIADALAFWKSPFLIEPKIKYNVPLNKQELITDLKTPLTEDNEIIINILRLFGTRYETKVEIEYKTIPMNIDISLTIPTGGRNVRIIHIPNFADKRDYNNITLDVRRTPINWSVEEKDPFSFYETPPHEVLHNQLAVWTEQHLFQHPEIRKAIELDTLKNKVDRIGKEFGKYEEILVDSISSAWLIQYARDNKLNLTPFYSTPKTERTIPVVYRLTPQALIKEYAEKGPVYFYKNRVLL